MDLVPTVDAAFFPEDVEDIQADLEVAITQAVVEINVMNLVAAAPARVPGSSATATCNALPPLPRSRHERFSKRDPCSR